MNALRLFFACLVGAVLVGVAVEEISLRMSSEYLALAYPALGPTTPEWTAALVWGALSLAWIGLGLGLALLAVGQLGAWPKLAFRDLRWAIAFVFGLVFVLCVMSLAAGWAAGVSERFPLAPEWREHVPEARLKHVTAALWIHKAAVTFLVVGGVALCGHACLLRWRRARGLVSAEK